MISKLFRISDCFTTGGYLLGDSGYACSSTLLTPFLRPSEQAHVRYNSAHRKTRVLIEQTFGRWKRRFAILHGEVRVCYKRVPLLIACCAILHNIAVQHGLPDFEGGENDNDDNEPIIDLRNDGCRFRNFIAQQHFS